MFNGKWGRLLRRGGRAQARVSAPSIRHFSSALFFHVSSKHFAEPEANNRQPNLNRQLSQCSRPSACSKRHKCGTRHICTHKSWLGRHRGPHWFGEAGCQPALAGTGRFVPNDIRVGGRRAVCRQGGGISGWEEGRTGGDRIWEGS